MALTIIVLSQRERRGFGYNYLLSFLLPGGNQPLCCWTWHAGLTERNQPVRRMAAFDPSNAGNVRHGGISHRPSGNRRRFPFYRRDERRKLAVIALFGQIALTIPAGSARPGWSPQRRTGYCIRT